MKKLTTLFLSLIYLGIGISQTIDLEEAIPGPTLQDARNGNVAFGDIDKDGDPDLIVTGKNPTVLECTLYQNDGTGNFTAISGTPFPGLQFGAIGFADVDNDGDPDLLMTGNDNQSNRFANLYLNDGVGNFTLDTSTPFDPNTEGDFAFDDVDNDGDLDLLMTGFGVNSLGFVKLYLNNGSGGFTVATGTPFEDVWNSSVAFIDIDNDSDKDLIIAGVNNSSTKVTKLYANDGAGNYSLVVGTSIADFDAGDIAVADADNDGDQDILICGIKADGTKISELYENNGTGVFSLVAGTPFIGTFLGTSDFADFDDDGDVDILVTGAVQGAEFAADIYENQGANSFVLSDVLVDVYFSSTAIADIDGDGSLDMVISGIAGGADAFKTRTYLNLSAPLPVNLIAFEAKVFDEKSIQLSWQTASEENNDYFTVEHCMDGKNFSEIARTNGYGTTSNDQHYAHMHSDLRSGSHYYRLKQVDFDGSYEYSNIVIASIYNNETDFMLMPNPTSGIISIQSKDVFERDIEVQLLTVQGKVVLSNTLQKEVENIKLDISNFPNGVYYLRLLDDNNLVTKKIIKQK